MSTQLLSLFFLFQKLNMKQKGNFEMVSDSQRKLQMVLDSTEAEDYHGGF
jgi:hypothetical protein